MSIARRITGGLLATATVALGACSSPGTHVAAPTTPAAYVRPACHITRPAPPVAKHGVGGASEYDITSFDGTTIRAHWFPNPHATAAHPVPTVLKGPGWGSSGDTNTKIHGNGLYGDTDIANLWDAGYNVLTWDPRGFGKSTGVITIDDPAHEGRDTQVLLDWVATQKVAQLDGPGDPRVGMVGGSYGGTIQLVLAAIDCRVDAIVPTIAWHSLATSLDKNDTAKQGWGDILYLAAHNRKLDPHITSSHTKSDTTGLLGAENVAWLAARGPGDLVQQITAPTLFLQGTVDTLFTLDEAVRNYTILQDKGVPTAMVWYCGGHGTCLTKAGDPVRTNAATIAWLARYLKGDKGVQTGAGFTTVDQNGNELSADAYPPAPGAAITASGSGSLHLVATKVQTPKPVPGASSGLIGAVALGITPARATNGLDVTVPIASAALVLGAPSLTITYSGTTPPGPKPTRVFAQLVDPTTNLVVGNQITPIPVTLDGHRHTATVPLEMVAFSAPAGGRLTLQIVASTAAYTRPRFGGTVHFATISVSLPTVSGMRTAAATR